MPSTIFKRYSEVLVFKTEQFQARRYIASNLTVIRGKEIEYECISEDNIFYAEDGHPIASIFSFSYFKKSDDKKSNRPVIFAFNGGPGASSVMLHSALLGPRQIVYPDDLNEQSFSSRDNDEWLLDIADIVLVDPVGTGFGVLLDESYSQSFYGIREDAEAFVSFVEMWLKRYKRYPCPKYIIAESYGCARAAMALDIASGQSFDRCYDISFSGVIFIGNTISEGRYFNIDLPVEKSVIGFITYAAINWYHNTNHSLSLDKWIDNVRKFANGEYLVALNKGNRLSQEEKREIVSKIMHYTGVSEEYLIQRKLRIDSYSFKNEILKDRELCVSRLDGRIVRPLFSSLLDEIEYGVSSDRARGIYNPVFLSLLLDSIFPLLGIDDIERPYVSQQKISNIWNKSLDYSLARCLEKVMKRNGSIRYFFANGYYDLTTEIGGLEYMLSHTDFDMNRCTYKPYPTGHMVYLGNDEMHVFCSDLRNFIDI